MDLFIGRGLSCVFGLRCGGFNMKSHWGAYELAGARARMRPAITHLYIFHSDGREWKPLC